MFHVKTFRGFLFGKPFRPLGRCSYELLEQPLEIFLILEFNLNLVLSVRRLHLYGCVQHIFQSFRHPFLNVLGNGSFFVGASLRLPENRRAIASAFSNRKFFPQQACPSASDALLSWEWTGLRVHDPPISSPRTIIAAPLREARANATH